MNRILGICNLHDGPHLGPLTLDRPLGCVTVLGRYGLMDFTLSNFSNSGINQIAVLVEDHVQAVRNHIGDGEVWVANTKTGFQRVMFNEKAVNSPKFNTDVANISANRHTLKASHFDYVVIAPAFFMMSVDFREAIKAHKYSGRKISILYKKIDNAKEEFINCNTLKFKKDKSIASVGINLGANDKENISLETFIMNKEEFYQLIDMTKEVSNLYTIRKMVNHVINNGIMEASAIEFKGEVVPFLSFDGYVKNSFKLLNQDLVKKILLKDWTIYTIAHSTPPSIYGPEASIKNSYVANGSMIYGTVENSILSRDVIVEKGAVVKNCIIFTHSTIGKDVHLENVLVDKTAKVVTEKDVKGEENNFLYINYGAKV